MSRAPQRSRLSPRVPQAEAAFSVYEAEVDTFTSLQSKPDTQAAVGTGSSYVALLAFAAGKVSPPVYARTEVGGRVTIASEQALVVEVGEAARGS